MADRKIVKYDDPNFTILREAHVGPAGISGSLTDFCHFRTRNKAIVYAAHVKLVSAASAIAGSLVIVKMRNHPSNTSVQTIYTKSLVSATSAGSAISFTLSSLNTMNSLADYIGIRLKSNAKGKWIITYEYQLLPSTLTFIP